MCFWHTRPGGPHHEPRSSRILLRVAGVMLFVWTATLVAFALGWDIGQNPEFQG